MNIADYQANDEDDCPRSKHIISPLFRVWTHPVSVEDHILAEAGQTVDSRPGEGQHNRKELARQHWHKN